MKNIAIFGAGGFGKEVACLINRINEQEPTWNLIGFFDDGKEKGKKISHFGICLGGVNELNEWKEDLAVAVAVGNSYTVQKIVENINNTNVYYPNLIHPNFALTDPESFKIGTGNIIQGACVASCDVKIGNFNVLNGYVVMGHDVQVGDYNTIMPGTRLSGEVHLGNNCFLGVNCVILQQITVPDNVRLAAGSVLMTNPKSGNLYLGVPAKKTNF